MQWRRVGLSLWLCWMPATALAHSRLVEPPSRTEENALMEDPCGGAPRGTPTVYEAGQTVELRWLATQSHSNQYRVAFSPAGDADFEDNVLGSRPDDPEVFGYVQPVPMPSCTCDDCTLQLRQLTETGMLAYYSCADIELVAPAGMGVPPCSVVDAGTTGGGTTGTATSSTGAVAGSTTEAAPVDGTEPTSSSSGGPAAQTPDGGCRLGRRGAWWSLLVLLLPALGRRRSAPAHHS